MDLLRDLTCCALLLSVIACAAFEAKETTFLRSARGHATQADVKNQLGSPKAVEATEAGETAWMYQVWDWQPGNRFTSTGAWCDEYVLTFDNQTILRGWTHQNYFHRGEAFPEYCVPDRYYSSAS